MQLSGEEITNCLIQEGFYPPKRINVLNPGEVLVLMRQLGLGSCYANKTKELLSEHEWWLPDLANCLEMPMVTLYNWVRRGWVRARQQPHAPRHWIIWADDSELERLKLHRQRPAGEVQKQLWRGEVPSIAMPPTDTDPS